MKLFKGCKRFMYSIPCNKKKPAEYVIRENKNLWYLPDQIKPNELKGETLSTNFRGFWFIGKVVETYRDSVKIQFPKGKEKDTHVVMLDEIHSIKT